MRFIVQNAPTLHPLVSALMVTVLYIIVRFGIIALPPKKTQLIHRGSPAYEILWIPFCAFCGTTFATEKGPSALPMAFLDPWTSQDHSLLALVDFAGCILTRCHQSKSTVRTFGDNCTLSGLSLFWPWLICVLTIDCVHSVSQCANSGCNGKLATHAYICETYPGYPWFLDTPFLSPFKLTNVWPWLNCSARSRLTHNPPPAWLALVPTVPCTVAKVDYGRCTWQSYLQVDHPKL